MMPVTEICVRMLPKLSSVAKEGLAAAKNDEQADQRQERRDVAHLGAQHRGEPARPFPIRSDCHAFT